MTSATIKVLLSHLIRIPLGIGCRFQTHPLPDVQLLPFHCLIKIYHSSPELSSILRKSLGSSHRIEKPFHKVYSSAPRYSHSAVSQSMKAFEVPEPIKGQHETNLPKFIFWQA